MTIAPTTPSLLEALSRFNRAVRAAGHRFDRAGTGIRRTEFALLHYLVRFGESRAGDIAAEYALDASVVSRQVGCLIERGCIERRTDPADARASLLAITEEGRDRLEEFDRTYSGFLAARFDDWSEERLARAATMLDELATKLFQELPHEPHPTQSAEKET